MLKFYCAPDFAAALKAALPAGALLPRDFWNSVEVVESPYLSPGYWTLRDQDFKELAGSSQGDGG